MIADIEAQCKGSVNAAKKWRIQIPSRRWNGQKSMGQRRLRTSTLTRERLERGEEQEILQEKSDELHSPTQIQDDSMRMMWKLKVISGRSQEISFIVFTWNSESNSTCRKKNHFLLQ